jgi:polyhydroxybutyrate depolymerase
MYLIGVFTFGVAGDLAARQSMYPTRRFTLPVTTAALVGWPMLYGGLVMALLWLATRLLAVWPSGVAVPLIWPAVLAAALLNWAQALTWMPYPARGLRVVVVVLWLSTIDTVVLLALHFQPSEPAMLALLAPHLPLAYLVACRAVARARRGDAPEWRLAARGGAAAAAPPFATPARAQAWIERRQHGGALPALVALVLPFELLLLFVSGDAPTTVFWILAGALLTPPFLAVFVAATVSTRLTPFLATKPIGSASVIAAKLKVALGSTLATWLLVLAAIPVALRLSHTGSIVDGWVRDAARVLGTPRALVLALLLLAALVGSTWKQLVQSLYVGMSGRAWLVKTSVFVALALLTAFVPFLFWVSGDRAAIAEVWNALPWIATVLAALKLTAASWVTVRLCGERLVSDRSLILAAAGWAAAALALAGVLGWIVPALFLPRHLLALVAILAVPLARIAAAPLALVWNRHGGRAARNPARRTVAAATLALLGLPAAVAAVEAVVSYQHDRNNGALVSSGERREYLLHVPPGLDRARPVPLVISLHGAGGWPAQQMEISRWNRLADEQGFLVVYPSGAGGRGPRVWHLEPGPGLPKDVRFIADLIDTIAAAYPIDRERVYANGLSNGGGLSFALSCSLADRIAAVGLVAPALTMPWSACADPRPVPVIAFHGTADAMVPYSGGSSWVAPAPFPDIPRFVAEWARRNRCAAAPVEAAVAADVTRIAYPGCAVELYRVEGGGHTWPGGEPLPEWFAGPTSDGVDATRVMWDFFRDHPIR